MFARALTRVARPVASNACRSMSVTGRFKQNEEAQERDFINRTERELINNLLKKMEKTIDPHDVTYRDTVKAVLAKHDVAASDALIDDLLAWKRTSL